MGYILTLSKIMSNHNLSMDLSRIEPRKVAVLPRGRPII